MTEMELSAIIEFLLFWSNKEPKWEKVRKEYGDLATIKMRRHWNALHGGN